MLSVYRAIMDPSINPLRHLPPAQRFQMMLALSVMWTTIFCASFGAWFGYGVLIVLHLAAAFGFLATGLIFRRAAPRRRACRAAEYGSRRVTGRRPPAR